MKKISSIILVLFLLASSITPASAAGPSAYESTVNVTNTTGTAGSVVLTYYNPNGSVKATYPDTIAANETKWYITLPGLTTSFEGSMVITSSVQLGAISTIIGKDAVSAPMGYGSYTGFSSGSSTVYLPLLMDSNYGFNTFYSIQNVSSAPVNVTIQYSDGLAVPAVSNLQPNASIKIDNLLEAHTAKKFSAILTATGPIAVSVVEWADGSYGNPILSYNGFSGGITNPILPMVNEFNYDYWTAIPIQNLGSVATNVTLTYTPTKAGTACTETITIPAQGQVEFGSYAFIFNYSPSTPPYQGMSDNCAYRTTFVGNARVTGNSANQPLVAIINQTTTIDAVAPISDKGGTLMHIDPVSATSSVVFPDVRQWYGTEHWWSSLTITNLSGASLPIGNITCRAVGSDPGGPVNTTFSNSAAIANNAGWIVDLFKDYGPMANGFVGGVVCTSGTGAKIVGTANTLGHDTAAELDSYALYEGISK